MPDELNSSFPYTGLRKASRPKGAHLYRIFSMTNRAPMTLFYRSQLVALAHLEFDRRVICYQAINHWYDGEDGSLFVAFYVRYMECDHLVYISDGNQSEVVRAFEKYSKGFDLIASSITRLEDSQTEIVFWNRLKMLSVIVREKDKLTERNVKQFLRSLRASQITINDLVQMQAYPESEALAYGFEMVRVGGFALRKIRDELLNGSTVISLPKSV